jgi:glycosyltransferase involved in cell wall biosynthesis
MRIAFILDGEFPPDPRVEKEVETLTKAGHDVTVFCKTKQARPPREHWKGATVVRRRLPVFSARRNLDKLVDYAVFPAVVLGEFLDAHFARRFDRVVVANPPDSLLVLINLFCALTATKAVDDFHDPFVELVANHYRSPLFKAVAWLLEALALATAWRVITVSPHCTRVLRSRFPRQIAVVSNCASASFKPSAKWRALRRKYGKFVLFSGNFIKQNGVMDFLRALDESKTFFRLKGLRAVVAGSGVLEAEIRRFIAEKQLADFVFFAGWRERGEIADWIAASEAVVAPFIDSPITRIGTPNKLYEALKLEKLVIASDLPGIRSVAGDAVVYYRAGDVDGLARAMQRVLSNSTAIYRQKKKLLERLSRELVWEKQERIFVETVCGD